MIQPVTCFLIDDDSDDVEIFKIALRRLNFEINCVTVDSGDAAVAKLANELNFIPDYIFLDVNMPLMGGLDCLKAIKNIPRMANVPVIIYSTAANPYYKEAALQFGAS